MNLFLAYIFLLLSMPQHSTEKLFWKENEKLSWEDFRGKPIPSASFVASTNTGISFEYSYTIKNNDVQVKYSVASFFTPQGSWYIPDRVNLHILKHEQAHFDISELHARILRKNLAGRKFSKKIKSEIESIYKQVEQKRRAMQTKFDAETDHSRNDEKEAFWQKHIAEQLHKYESWK
ncbi:DUF922 domain-containing protein [Aequorivita viscosa]|nr:DUF922 domain-containing protein [Aequorivita viscosa]